MFLVNRRMMLKYDIVAQDFAEDRGCLIDNGCEGYRRNDPFETVVLAMVESKSERGERLTAAGRHCEREDAGRFSGAASHMGEYLGAQTVHGSSGRGLTLLRHVGVKGSDEPFDDIGERRPFAINPTPLRPRIESLGVTEI